MKEIVIRCDECGAAKGQSNHWISFDRLGIATITFRPFAADAKGHLCGRECAHKLLDKVLGGTIGNAHAPDGE